MPPPKEAVPEAFVVVRLETVRGKDLLGLKAAAGEPRSIGVRSSSCLGRLIPACRWKYLHCKY